MTICYMLLSVLKLIDIYDDLTVVGTMWWRGAGSMMPKRDPCLPSCAQSLMKCLLPPPGMIIITTSDKAVVGFFSSSDVPVVNTCSDFY